MGTMPHVTQMVIGSPGQIVLAALRRRRWHAAHDGKLMLRGLCSTLRLL